MPISTIVANSLASGVPTASQGGSIVLISSGTAAASSAVSFTGLSLSGYSAIQIIANNITVATNAVTLQCQMSSAGTFATSGYAHVEFRMVQGGSASSGSISDTQINICSSGDTLNNSSTIGNSFTMTVYGPAQTNTYKQYTSQFSGYGSDYIGVTGQGAYKYATAVDGIKFFVSSGNITTGNFYLYGIRNS